MSKLKKSSLLALAAFAILALVYFCKLFTPYFDAIDIIYCLLHSAAFACIAYFFFILYKNQK